MINKRPDPPGQVDRYVHDRLPPVEQWPRLPTAGDADGDPLNCLEFLLDRHARGTRATATAVASDTASWSYAELNSLVNRIARVFKDDFGVESGNRVLLRGPNSPMLAALWLATQKIGAIAVTTMPLLRADELSKIIAKSRPRLAVSHAGIEAELANAILSLADADCQLLSNNEKDGELETRMRRHPDTLETFATRGDDISLIGFTSGTTGMPKATIHFHRDVLAVCRCLCDTVIRPTPDDLFIGTSPLAFTFGLGAMAMVGRSR